MQTKLNDKGEQVYIFDEYPDIEVRPEVITTGDVAEYALRARQVGLERVGSVEYYPPMIL